MSKKICHLLIVYGNKNQKYTQDFLENINEFSNDEHFIYCHDSKLQNNRIKVVVSVKQPKIIAIFQFIQLYISEAAFRKLTKQLSIRNIYKWLWLAWHKYEVLHIHHEHAISTNVIEYFKSKKVKIIISLRGRDLLINNGNNSVLNHLSEKLVLVDEVHCISNYMKDELLKLYGLRAKVIYRGQLLPEKNSIKLSANTGKIIKIIVVGRLVWEKGHIYLIESIHRLIKRGFLFKVDIYGDGNLKEFLQFRVNQLGLDNIIYLKGFYDNTSLKTLYKNYDIAVQPSISEALSNGLIDFMFHNLPCVITNAGGMPEIIKNGKNGILFDKKNMLELDEAILESRKIDFQKLIIYNEKILDKFSLTSEIEGMLDLYK